MTQQDDKLVIAINIPSHDMCHGSFAGDLARLVAYTAAHFIPGDIRALLVNQVSGTLISTARNELARGALEQKADYMLWIDSDMRFPRDALVRLLIHEKLIVGANYARRHVDTDYVAIKRLATADGPGERLQTRDDSTGLEEVEGIGFGLALTHASVLYNLPERPWFQFGYDHGVNRQISEDIWFCKAARAAGIPIHVDHDLSKEVRHSGVMEFRTTHAQARYDYEEESRGAHHELQQPPDGDC